MRSMDYLRRDDREWHLSADGLTQDKWENCTIPPTEQEGEQSRQKELSTIASKTEGYLPPGLFPTSTCKQCPPYRCC